MMATEAGACCCHGRIHRGFASSSQEVKGGRLEGSAHGDGGAQGAAGGHVAGVHASGVGVRESLLEPQSLRNMKCARFRFSANRVDTRLAHGLQYENQTRYLEPPPSRPRVTNNVN